MGTSNSSPVRFMRTSSDRLFACKDGDVSANSQHNHPDNGHGCKEHHVHVCKGPASAG
jgi:hypothetical protein